MRQKFLDQPGKQADHLGLAIPDQDLKWNEGRGHYDFGPIDWEEFARVVKGGGLCNDARLEARRTANDEGQWVKDALMSYAEKHSKSDVDQVA